MGIDDIIKKEKEIYRNEGLSNAIGFLLSVFEFCTIDEYPKFFARINILLKKDIESLIIRNFVEVLIQKNIIDKYSSFLIDYYWIIKDYENYKLALKTAISRTNPNDPWLYCFNMQNYYLLLSKYYDVKGLEKPNNAIDYLYHVFLHNYFFLASDILNIGKRNFENLHRRLKWKKEAAFCTHDRILYMSDNIHEWFSGKKGGLGVCLKSIATPLQIDEIVEIIRSKMFTGYVQKLGYKFDVLDRNYTDLESFALTFFEKEDFNDIVSLHEKIKQWEIIIASKTVGLANDGSNEIIGEIMGKKLSN